MDVFSRISKAISGSSGPQTPSNEAQASASKPRESRPANHRRTESSRQSIVDSFKDNWRAIQALLVSPDQAALHHGISRTDLARRLQDLSDALISEANRLDEESEIAGPCMESLLEGDLLGRLVRLTANDRIAGSQAQVVKLFASLIILLDESFLSRQAVHRPLVRLMRICVGDEFFNSSSSSNSQTFEGEDEDEETKAWRRFGRDGSAEALGFEEDLVDMMCHVASRLRNSPELLIIFFRDRGGDAEAKRAFNRALVGMPSTPQHSYPGSRTSTRPTSPAGSTTSSATIMATMPAISSPLRPPDSLPIPPRKDVDASSNASTSTSLTYDFPLFSYLLRFVHRESRTGELARAGLLFLVDVAFAPGRRNISQARRRTQNSNRGGRGTLSRRGGGSAAASSARVRLDVDFGLGPSLALARYMLESDFAEVLAASLGAVYGLLPNKLASSRQSASRGGRDETSGMSLGGSVLPSVEDDPPQQRGIALTASEEVRKQARLLADLLEFTQDILRTSSRQWGDAMEGEDKKRTVIELAQTAQSLTAAIGRSIQTLFLENILYPSLLECSDADGSAVAVMSYLDLMLSVMENDGPLARFIVGWLIGEERQTSAESMEKRKHKSTAMLQLEKEKGSKAEASTYFSDAMGRYTIKDLLLDHLKRSVKAEASITAVRLASTIVTYYGQYALQGVLLVVADDAATAFPDNVLAANVPEQEEDEDDDNDDSEEFVYPGASKEDDIFREKLQSMALRVVSGVNISQHAREMSLYLSLAKLVERGHTEGAGVGSTQVESSSTGFDNYLDDAEQSLIRDSMFWDGLSDQEDIDKYRRVSFRHRLGSQDPLVQSLLEMLCHFWQNAPEVNVALTGLITDLAVCPMRSLEGFIVFERQSEEVTEVNGPPSDEIDEAADDDRSDDEILFAQTSRESQSKRRYSTLFKNKGGSATPIVLCILRSLVLVLDHYRPEVSGFDRLLQERRKGLLYVEKLTEALQAERRETSESGYSVPSSASHYEPPHDSIKKIWQGIDVSSDVVEVASSRRLSSRAKKISLPPPPSATMEIAEEEEDKARSASRREGFARFFGRGNTAKVTSTNGQDANGQAVPGAASNSTPSVPQPFAQHYQETSSIFLNMDDLRLSSKSKWSPNYKEVIDTASVSKEKRTRFKDVDGDGDDEGVLYPGREETKKDGTKGIEEGDNQLVNLSALLDNAVILEEFIKELAAILQIRRTNGIDAIRFV